MKRIFFCLILALTTLAGMAQKYDVSRKTGLMTLDERPYCYIIPANNGGTKQFIVRDLQQQDLILVSENEGRKWNRETQAFEGDEFRFVFLQSHGWCGANSGGLSYNNYMRIAKILVRENLIVGGVVAATSEQNFIRKNAGVAGTVSSPSQPAAPTATPAAAPAATTTATTIRIAADKIYTGNKLVGSFSRTAEEGESITVYNVDDVIVARAKRAITGGDWDIEIAREQKKLGLRYYADRSIERLLQFLYDKGHLK
jgi:hypothetical protein